MEDQNVETLTDLLREEEESSQQSAGSDLAMATPKSGVYSIISDEFKRARLHYVNEEWIQCNAQDEHGKPTDKPCAICSAARLRPQYKVKERFHVLAYDVTTAEPVVLYWNRAERKSIDKNGGRPTHFMMLEVFKGGIPSKPFQATPVGQFSVKAEYPELSFDKGELEAFISKFDKKLWENFDPKNRYLSLSDEDIRAEYPEIDKVLGVAK